MHKIIAPKYNGSSFNCPNCNAYSHQTWYSCYTNTNSKIYNLNISYCAHCEEISIWFKTNIIYPNVSCIQPPNNDLDEDIKNDYIEATSIINKSPRGAAALLRLAIQKLCKQLGEKGKDINTDISNLVKKGLPLQVQQALDIVRVVGNESVHPGQIDLNDDKEIANKLFELINIIAQVMITQPKEIQSLYENIIPDTKKEAIKKRDE